MTINPEQLRSLIRRTLKQINLYSPNATELLMGTSAHESHLGTYIRQINGPALGILQMEPSTERDIWKNYLQFRPQRIDDVIRVASVAMPSTWALETNLAYQIIMARLHYRRVAAPLPSQHDIHAMAAYWDDHYNCNPNKGFPEQWTRTYHQFC